MGNQTTIFDEGKANEEHMKVFGIAHDIFKERNSLRGDDWKSKPLGRHLDNAEDKISRIRKMESMIRPIDPKDLDELVDLMNYANFAYQELRRRWLKQEREYDEYMGAPD